MSKLLTVVALLFCSTAFGNVKTKALMENVLENYLQILPEVYGESDEGNLSKNLKNLENAFKNAGHDSVLNKPNFSPSLGIIKNTFQELSNNTDKNKDYVIYRSKKLVSTCISCHSQLPKSLYPKVTNKYSEVINKHVRSDFDKGLLSYMLRDYGKAISHLQKDFEKSLKDKSLKYRSEDILKTILKIFIVNKEDIVGAKKYFYVLLKRNDISSNLKNIIEIWYKSLEKNMDKGDINLNDYIVKYLKPIEEEIGSSYIHENDYRIFRMKNILNRYSSKDSNKAEMPAILYWQGIIENREDTIYLSSLGDMYLKECVEKFPQSHYAVKCLNAYENSITFSFTGSAGESIPEELKQDLARLKKLIKK